MPVGVAGPDDVTVTVPHDCTPSYGPTVRRHDLGSGIELVEHTDGTIRFHHPCKSIEYVDDDEVHTLRCGPALAPGHLVVWPAGGPPTVSPSVLCPDCSTHGFVVDGAWRSA